MGANPTAQVQKLNNALREYENDKWRVISTKVGSGFSPTACKDKASELSGGEFTGEHSPELEAAVSELLGEHDDYGSEIHSEQPNLMHNDGSLSGYQ